MHAIKCGELQIKTCPPFKEMPYLIKLNDGYLLKHLSSPSGGVN